MFTIAGACINMLLLPEAIRKTIHPELITPVKSQYFFHAGVYFQDGRSNKTAGTDIYHLHLGGSARSLEVKSGLYLIKT